MSVVQPWRLLLGRPTLLGLALVFAGVEIVALRGDWDVARNWPSVVEAADGAFQLLAVLVVGSAAAVAVGPWHDRELTSAFPDSGSRAVASTGVVVGVLAAGVHFVTMVGLLVWGYVVGLPGPLRLWPVLSVLAGLFVAALFGTAVVRLGAGVLAPVLAMGLWIALIYGVAAVGGVDLFDLGGVSIVLVGIAPDTTTVLWRAAWLAAAAGVVWAIAAHGRRTMWSPLFLVQVVATVTLAAITVQESRAGFVQTSVQLVCEPGPPQVCVTAEYDHRLAEYTTALTRLAPLADQVGLTPPPEGYRQGFGIRAGPGSFSVDDEGLQIRQLAFDLVQFALPCSIRWDLSQLEQADVVSFWVLTQAGYPLPEGPPGTRIPTLAEAQRALEVLQCDR